MTTSLWSLGLWSRGRDLLDSWSLGLLVSDILLSRSVVSWSLDLLVSSVLAPWSVVFVSLALLVDWSCCLGATLGLWSLALLVDWFGLWSLVLLVDWSCFLGAKLSSRRQFELEPLVAWSLVSWFLDLLSSWPLGFVASDLRTLCVHKNWRSNLSHFYFLALDNAPVPENQKKHAFLFHVCGKLCTLCVHNSWR